METKDNKKSFFQNDRLLVCSMLVFYGICGIGLVTAVFWVLNRGTQIIANTTLTAEVPVTKQAISTSTAVARATEQGKYAFIDRFDANTAGWLVGSQDNSYWEGSTHIKDGVYTWDVTNVKKIFVWWADFYHGFPIKDFDVYLDTKFVEGTPGYVCSGLVFRKSPKGWNEGAYLFTVCNDSTFRVDYHGENGWEDISKWKYNDVIQRFNWNRIEISARGEYFIFTINNKVVYELTDDRLAEGGLAIVINVRDKKPAEIWFDNFAYQIP